MKLFYFIIAFCVLQLVQGFEIGRTDRYDGIAQQCLIPMEFGYCRAKVKRFYFDSRRMKCSMFYWGGCSENLNNFKTLEECNNVCFDAYEENGVKDNRGGNYNNNQEVNSRKYAKTTKGTITKTENPNYKIFKTSKNYNSADSQEQFSGEEYES